MQATSRILSSDAFALQRKQVKVRLRILSGFRQWKLRVSSKSALKHVSGHAIAGNAKVGEAASHPQRE